MASALDRALNNFRARPRDMSGQKKAKVSLIFEPTVAASTSAGTFYQVGYAGYTELLQIDHRIKKFEKSIFNPSITDVDPLFLTAEEYNPLREKVRELMFFLSNYCMEVSAVKVLEYLIQQFAVNRLNPEILLFITLPYLETPLFVRVIQTIPFKAMPKAFDFLDDFRHIAQTKKPIDRKLLISWIIKRPNILPWIISNAPRVCAYHPDGVYASFVGVLFSQLVMENIDEAMGTNIINAAMAALDDPNGYLAPQYLMAVLTLNEKKELGILPKITKKISSNAETVFANHFSEMFSLTVALFQKSVPIHVKEGFVHAIASQISSVKDLIRNTDTTVIAKSCSNLIIKKSKNESLVKSAIAILETNFFETVAKEFLLGFVENYPGGEYAEMLVQKLANDYPEILTEDVNSALKSANISVRLSAHTRQSIIDSLSESSKAAAVFADPDLQFDLASNQAVSCLTSAESADSVEVVEPLIKYFKGRCPEHVLQWICEHLFISGSKFSDSLIKNISVHGKELSEFLEGFPTDSNKSILSFLSAKSKELPNYKSLPIAAAKALNEKSSEKVTELIKFLPQRKLDYSVVRNLEKKIYEDDLEFVADTLESQAAFILAVTHKIAEQSELTTDNLLALFSFPDFRCLLPIVVLLATKKQLNKMTSVFHLSNQQENNAKINCLTLIAVVLPMSNPYDIIPTLFCALKSPVYKDRAMELIRGIPLKEEGIKDVLPYIIKHHQLFGNDEQTTIGVFTKSCSKQETRTFYNHCWEHIQDCSIALDFFLLTNDKECFSTIKKLEKEPKIVDLFDKYIQSYPDNEEAKEWALNTLNSGIIKSVIPYLNETKLSKCLPFVCSYPQYYATSFNLFFKNHNIPYKDIEKEITKGQTSAIKESKTEIPPQIFANKNFNGLLKSLQARIVVSPCQILLENISNKQEVEGIVELVPSIISLFDMKENSNLIPYIFNCLLMAIKKENEKTDKKKKSCTDIMIENFSKIISSISSTTVPHIHSTALQVVEELARVKPEEVAKHAKTFFSAMPTETLFSDDVANLARINQLLSSVLPILEKANTIMELLNFFSENIDRFSMDRASKIMIHSIGCLNSESYRVFDSLLKHDKVDFALTLTDQMKAETLMSSIIRLTELTEKSDNFKDFISQIQFPSLPVPMIRFFMVLQKKFDEDEFRDIVTDVCNSWGLPDFISFSEEAVVKPTMTTLVQSLITQRISNEPSPLFSSLLKPLQSLIEHGTELQLTLNTLQGITQLLEDEHAPIVSTLITKTLDAITQDSVKPSIQLAALSFAANAVEKFKMSILDVYPPVLDFAASFLQIVVEHEAADAIGPTVGSVCLLLSASPEFSADKLVKIVPSLLSPMILNREELNTLVSKNLTEIVAVLTLDQVLPSFVATLEVKNASPESLIEMFDLMTKSLKHSDVHMVRRLQATLLKFFLLAFTIRFDDILANTMFQDAVADSFGEYANRLNEQLFAIAFSTILQYMLTLSDKKQKDYVVGRFFFARVVYSIVNTLREVFAKFYSSFFDSFIQFVLESDDGILEEREVTIRVMSVLTKICDYADQVFFETRFSKVLDAIKLHFNYFEGELTTETMETESDREKTYEYKMFVLGNAFAALMNASKTNLTQMMNVLIEQLRNEKSIIVINILNVLLICSENARDNFSSVFTSALPVINELLEHPDADIQAAARNAVHSLARTNESVRNFFISDQ